jgi:hypothetical protein
MHVVEICRQIEDLPAPAEAGSAERLLGELEREAALAQAALTRLSAA